jgi:hypothetical protein
MADTQEPEDKGTKVHSEQTGSSEGAGPCERISDPVRKGLCKACELPVIGEAPFCKDFENIVP